MNVRKPKHNTEQSEGKCILYVDIHVKWSSLICLVVLLLQFMLFENMYQQKSNKLF